MSRCAHLSHTPGLQQHHTGWGHTGPLAGGAQAWTRGVPGCRGWRRLLVLGRLALEEEEMVEMLQPLGPPLNRIIIVMECNISLTFHLVSP